MFKPRIAAATAVALVLALGAEAGAQSDAARQTYSDRFTTDEPGASTGRAYAIDYFRPEDRNAKPHAFSHLQVELADGARFDTSAIPQCTASDAQLMASGPSACPADTKVGTDETVVDTGFSGPGRFFTTDFHFFNNKDELILLAMVRENGARVVVRGKIGRNTLDIDNPMIPGTPPDGGAAKSQRGTFFPRASRGRAYITTPARCPSSGYWVNKVNYTYRDGVRQTSESRSPCRQAGSAGSRRLDRRRPAIRVARIARRCVTRSFRARVRVADESELRWVKVALGRRTLATSRRKRLAVRIPARRLRPGRHRIRVAAVDEHGNRARRVFLFRRCRR